MKLNTFSSSALLLALPAFLTSCTVMGVKPDLPDMPQMNLPLIGQDEPVEATVDFYRNIKPVLETQCLACHNSQNAARGLNLESAELANSSWRGGPVVVPDHPDRSMLYQVTLLDSEGADSPHAIPYEDAQLLYTWIAEGATWPADARLSPAAAGE